jgi:hypothetical protein
VLYIKREFYFRKKIFSILLLLVSISLGVHFVRSFQIFVNKATGKPANLVVDLGISYSTSNFVWKNFAQGGEERNNMLASVVGEMKRLEPNYIRIDHVYDFYDVVSKDENGDIQYDWEELDEVVDSILQMGAKPFFSLSYSPKTFSSNGTETGMPDLSQWEALIKATVEQYSGKDNYAISLVYYEVWNEPDLIGDFKTYGDKNYLKLYEHSVRGAQSAENINIYKIGGPATTDYYENWVDDLIDHSRINVLWLDFISWHKYSTDLSEYADAVNKVREKLLGAPGFENSEIIISEVGHNSEMDFEYDGEFAAIHTIATAAVLEDVAKRVFYFEIKDGPGPEKYWGGFGMLTHEKLGGIEAKPRYLAIEFLNKMVGKKLNIAGRGSSVKAFGKEDDGVYRLLIVNYDPSGKHTEEVPIKFINMEEGSYVYRRIDYQGAELEKEILVEENVWKTSEYFIPNSAAIIEIVPQ